MMYCRDCSWNSLETFSYFFHLSLIVPLCLFVNSNYVQMHMFINESLDVFLQIKTTSVKKKENSFLYFERDIFVFTSNKYFVQRRQTS